NSHSNLTMQAFDAGGGSAHALGSIRAVPSGSGRLITSSARRAASVARPRQRPPGSLAPGFQGFGELAIDSSGSGAGGTVPINCDVDVPGRKRAQNGPPRGGTTLSGNCPGTLPLGKYRATHRLKFPRLTMDMPRRRLDAQTSCVKCPVASL